MQFDSWSGNVASIGVDHANWSTAAPPALLSGMDDLLRQEVGLPIFLADDPLTSVAIGTGKVLDEIDLLATIELAS